MFLKKVSTRSCTDSLLKSLLNEIEPILLQFDLQPSTIKPSNVTININKHQISRFLHHRSHKKKQKEKIQRQKALHYQYHDFLMYQTSRSITLSIVCHMSGNERPATPNSEGPTKKFHYFKTTL